MNKIKNSSISQQYGTQIQQAFNNANQVLTAVLSNDPSAPKKVLTIKEAEQEIKVRLESIDKALSHLEETRLSLANSKGKGLFGRIFHYFFKLHALKKFRKDFSLLEKKAIAISSELSKKLEPFTKKQDELTLKEKGLRQKRNEFHEQLRVQEAKVKEVKQEVRAFGFAIRKQARLNLQKIKARLQAEQAKFDKMNAEALELMKLFPVVYQEMKDWNKVEI